MKYLFTLFAALALSTAAVFADTAAITASATPSFAPGAAISHGYYDMLTYTPAQDATFSASTLGAVAGKATSLKVLTSGTTSYVLTFSTGFTSPATLTTGSTSGVTFVIDFLFDGTTFRETGRWRQGAGIVSPRLFHTGGMPARISTDGTNATPSVTETYLAEVFVPAYTTLTGISVFNGSATGTSGVVTVYLSDAYGKKVANSATTTIVGTDVYQRVPFTATIAIPPGTYYVLTQYNATDTRFNTHVFGDFGAGKLTGTVYGTYPTVTIPTTFTADLGPIASLY